MRWVCLLALSLLAACTQGADRRAFLNGLIGAPETDVVRIMGVPARAIETGGRKFLAYEERSSSIVYAPQPVFFGGGMWGPGWGYANTMPGEIVARQCETTFELVDGRVVSYTLRGNACG